MPLRSHSLVAIAICLAGALVMRGQGQAQAPTAPALPAPTLATERAAFLRQVLSESQLLTEQYERALAKLEAELAASAEYEEALLVQQRRAELKALYPAGASSLAQSLAIPLTTAQARLLGSTEVRGDIITGWRTAGSGAEWLNVRVTPGEYFLELEALMLEVPGQLNTQTPGRSQPLERAGFEFYEMSLLAGAQENRRSFEVSLTADEGNFTPLRIGPVTFSRNTVTLRLTVATGYPSNIIRLRNLRLVPVTEDTPTAVAPPTTAGAEIEELRKTLNAALLAAQAPVVASHLAELTKVAAADRNLRDEANSEAKRLRQALENARKTQTPLSRSTTSQNIVDGFEDIQDARYVADPENTGDAFMVESNGQRFRVRLMGVLCAPLDAKSPARNAFARHFDLSEDEVANLAKLAQEFTAGYLEGKPLRLLARPDKEKDGSVVAWVFLPEVGLFQNVLIDQGLAAVHQPPAGVRRPGTMRGLLGSLMERERAAKRQGSGAWALAGEDKP